MLSACSACQNRSATISWVPRRSILVLAAVATLAAGLLVWSSSLERLATSIAFAALVIGGSMPLLTPTGGWHHVLDEGMIVSGIVGMVIAGIGALRREHDQR